MEKTPLTNNPVPTTNKWDIKGGKGRDDHRLKRVLRTKYSKWTLETDLNQPTQNDILKIIGKMN